MESLEKVLKNIKRKERIPSLYFGKFNDIKKKFIYYFCNCDETIGEYSKEYDETINPNFKLPESGHKFHPFIYFKEYDEIIRYLEDTGHRGLALLGTCGVGKTIIIEYVIKCLFYERGRKDIPFFKSKDIKDKEVNYLKERKINRIDDVGEDEILFDYGNKIDYFRQVVDNCDKQRNILFFSSNIGKDKFINRYGQRIYSRVNGLCKIIIINKQDLRGL